MKRFIILLLQLAAWNAAFPNSPDTIKVSDFGIRPGTFENCVTAIQEAIDSCRSHPGCVLMFEKGRYDIWPEGAVRKEIYISNTSSEIECPSKVKTLGLHFDSLSRVTVEGSGATLMMHGKITPLAIDNCSGIEIRNLTVDFERPGGSEMTYHEVAEGHVTMKALPESRYVIYDKRINLVGEGWRSNKIHCISYSPTTGHATYSSDWSVLSNTDAEEIAPGLIAFDVPRDFRPEQGAVLTLRDIIRDQVGTLILESSDVVFRNINMRYMHGLGIVSQFSHNITMDRVECCPDSLSGRILASSADFMHFSGCSGKISVTDCTFSGSHDDAINVHGTNLRIEEKTGDSSLRLRFMHHQSYGFMAFHPGDTVAFVDPATMLRTSIAIVRKVERQDPRVLAVGLDRPIPENVAVGTTCLENLTCTPEVFISRCSFTRSSTRGILVTTPRKVIIENNTFTRLGMAAILIEADAKGWYESGPVCDVAIRGNTFEDCGYNGAKVTFGATIALNPSNSVMDSDKPVHENITITGNVFSTEGRPVLSAKSTRNISFTDNIVEGLQSPRFIFKACSDIVIAENKMTTPEIDESDCLRLHIADNKKE